MIMDTTKAPNNAKEIMPAFLMATCCSIISMFWLMTCPKTCFTNDKIKPKVKMTFRYEVTNEEGKLIHTGSTTLFFMDKNTRRPTRAPQEVLDALSPYFNEG